MNSETAANDPNLEIRGDDLYRADHPSSFKRGGVCISYKVTLPLLVVNISNLNEYINFKFRIVNKICHFIHLHRSPSQTQDRFQIFTSNLELNLNSLSSCNTSPTILIGDFRLAILMQNLKSCEIDITSFEGSQLLTSKFGLPQISFNLPSFWKTFFIYI